MGRYVKNKELRSGSYSIRLPMGSSVIGPDAPVTGLTRFNIDTNEMELYVRNQWKTVKSIFEAERLVVKDTFYGDSITRNFGPLKYTYKTGQEVQVLVFVGNVFQNPGVAYYLDDNEIYFSSPPPDGHQIIVLHGYAG